MATIVACPQCQRRLKVPAERLGRELRCPQCAHRFGAGNTPARSPGPPPLPDMDAPAHEEPPEDELANPLDEETAARTEPTEPGQRRKRNPRSKRSSSGGYYDELMRKQSKLATPHRGVLILVFGICSILCSMGLVGAIFGVLAWNWGTNDLNEMLSGRMDRAGRSLTQVGRIMGMVGISLCLVWVLGSCGCGMLGGLTGKG